MNARGHRVEVASLDAPEDPWVRSCGLPVHACGPAALAYGYSRRLVPWLQANMANYDAVIVNGIWEYHSLAVRRALRTSQTPYFVFPHGMLDPWFRKTFPLKHLKKSLYWPWGGYPVLRDAEAVIFTAEEERLLARESFPLYSCREKVVSLGTSGAPPDAAAQRRAFFEQFPETRDQRVLLFMGRIHPKKGCDLAIEAFASVLRGQPGWRLVFAGPDQIGWQNVLKTRAAALGIADRITWTGMLTGDAKWGAYRAADALLLPSHQENFGMVVSEALACGVPGLISNKVNIWREVLQDGAGIVAVDDLEGVCQLLRTWTSMNSADQSSMRQRARRCFEQRFEINKAADSILSCIGAGSQHGGSQHSR